jgi:uncharacterized protein YjbI with pentapeptide repeats
MNDTSRPAAPQALEESRAAFAPEADNTSDLRAEELRGRDLRGRDLTEVEGLLPEHLAGADLTRAKLPPEIAKFPALEQVKAISAEARKVFIGLLAACVYSWLVIGTTTDVALILNTASSPLPIINTPIPIAGFYVIGGSVLAAVYCYLHFYLQRLWRTLASLPAVFPDGVALDDKTDPWLLTNLIRTDFELLRTDAPPLIRLENLLAVFLAWWLVPLTLIALWARYLPAHGWLGTSWLVFLIGLATLFSRHTYRLARVALQGLTSRNAEPTDADRGILTRAWREFRGLRPDKLTVSVLVTLVVCSFSAFRDDPRDPHAWVVQGLNGLGFIGIHTYADLREVEVAQKPEGWDGKDWSKVKRVDLRDVNLAFADARSAFLANADLRGANLHDAILPSAQLQGANLRGANLQYALLAAAKLDVADLTGAQLQETEFYLASLRRGVFDGAQLQGAGFHYAQLQGASLAYAGLQAADLGEAQLQAANLSLAQLQGADLRGAQFQGASLRGAQFQGADLRGAQFEGADLREAALWRSLIVDVGWNLADLRGMTVQPMSKSEIGQLISGRSAAVADGSWRNNFAEWMTWRLRDDDRPGVPEFPEAWRRQVDLMFDRPPTPDSWGNPKWATEQAYDKDLAGFLGVLACGGNVPEAQARGLARRALDHDNRDRLFAALLAAHLTGSDCPPAKGLPDDMRRQLEQLAGKSGPSKAPEAIAPGPR